MAHFAPTRILCPTDMSEVSRHAVRTGLAWARVFGAKVYVLSAREFSLPPRYFTPDQMAALARQGEHAEDQVREELEKWVAAMNPTGIPVDAVVGPGPADRAILRAVDVIRPELVVMGTHGRSGYSRFLMGSTTEKVVREIPVPLLIVRGQERHDLPPRGEKADLGVRRILCAADAPTDAGANLATVAALARIFKANLTVLHSLEAPAWLEVVPPEVRTTIERRLKELVRTRGADLSLKTVIVEGRASEQILDQAARDGSDLIVVGGRQPTETTPAFRATAIRVMRQAACPVLALPGPQA